MSEFYRRLDQRMIEERNARIFRDRPENLHDYQGCARDAQLPLHEACGCYHPEGQCCVGAPLPMTCATCGKDMGYRWEGAPENVFCSRECVTKGRPQ